MPLLSLENYCLNFGEQVIFDQLSLNINPGDKLCVLGRNGVGKSTLLKCIAGSASADSGSHWLDKGAQVALLSQDLPETDAATVYEFVAQGLAELGADLARFDKLVAQADEASLRQLENVQRRIEAADGWRLQNKIEQVLTRLELDGNSLMSSLSGGWRRRAALAQALVQQPDILLLDEPTNHLDIGAIRWLEEQLKTFAGALIFITHDRAFLRGVANCIGELDRGQFSVWRGNYDGFLQFRAQQLEAEAKHNALFDKKLAQEEVWIRQGIKARRTRNEGRVRSLENMRQERKQRRDTLKTSKMEHSMEVSSGKLVAQLDKVSFRYDETAIISNFSTTIIRGDKIGLIGPNGIGKSTLLKILLGELQPQEGRVKLGTKIDAAYFDQLRAQLDLEKSAIDNIAEGRESITLNGRDKHIISYLQDFLFSGERARTPIKSLSGGERNRILLAKLFSQSSNLLVLDEPTNDLDAETLELLEELLASYSGTLLLVSHDREFLDNVVTSSIAFEGRGKLLEYVGGYSDWLRQGGHWFDPTEEQKKDQKRTSSKPSSAPGKPAEGQANQANQQKKSTKKLSYKLQRELDALPEQLEQMEAEIETINTQVSAADFYQQSKEKVNQVMTELAEKEQQLQQMYQRWSELESLLDD